MRMSRRTVLKGTAQGLWATLLVGTGWAFLRFLSPPAQTGTAGTATVARAEVPVGGAHFFVLQGRPAVVVQPEPGRYTALSAVCTHLGCIVKWSPQESVFLCPCHAARFSSQGAVLSGPPPAPLETYALSVRGDQLLIGKGNT